MMPILQTGMNRERFHRSGFTLIELIIVIFIISLTAALIMPNMWDTGERSVKLEAKRIGTTLRYLYDEAVGKKEIIVLRIDLDRDAWGFESEIESRSFTMRDKVMFRDIIVPSLGEVSIGELLYSFGTTGPEEPITIHLMRGDKDYTVIFNHLSGRAKVYAGYIS